MQASPSSPLSDVSGSNPALLFMLAGLSFRRQPDVTDLGAAALNQHPVKGGGRQLLSLISILLRQLDGTVLGVDVLNQHPVIREEVGSCCQNDARTDNGQTSLSEFHYVTFTWELTLNSHRCC